MTWHGVPMRAKRSPAAIALPIAAVNVVGDIASGLRARSLPPGSAGYFWAG
jgi:hypothetical protein